jgi:membrane fusion protein, copper/silver efflux system
MTRFAAVAIVTVLLLSGTSLQASDAMKAIIASYVDIHAQLFRDKMDGVKPAAAAIAVQASRMGAGGAAMAAAAKRMEDAADLKGARDAFGALSDAVIAAGNAEGWKDVPDIKVAYCPMVNKSWLQKEGSVRNPYYGPAMPTCGEFKKP